MMKRKYELRIDNGVTHLAGTSLISNNQQSIITTNGEHETKFLMGVQLYTIPTYLSAHAALFVQK